MTDGTDDHPEVARAAEKFTLSLEYYVVGFFDLLGQQEHLRSLRTLPDKSDPVALAKTRDDLKKTFGAVMGMRKLFEDSFVAYARKPLSDVGSLTEPQRAMYMQMDNNPIEFKGISDSMVVFVSLRDAENAKLPVRAVLGVLSAAALTFLGSLGVGHPIRGGIDIGLGFKTPNGEIYGPALSRAYTLESKIADYPRIVVGAELVRYLNDTITKPAVDPRFTEQARLVAEACVNCLAQDDDGNPFIDYLGPYFRQLLAAKEGVQFVDAAYNHVIEFSDRFKTERNSKLAFRYTLLRNYFEDRLSLWAGLPR